MVFKDENRINKARLEWTSVSQHHFGRRNSKDYFEDFYRPAAANRKYNKER